MDAFCSVEEEEEEEEEEEGSLCGSKMHGWLLCFGNTMCLAGVVEVRHSLKASFRNTQNAHQPNAHKQKGHTHQPKHPHQLKHTRTQKHTVK